MATGDSGSDIDTGCTYAERCLYRLGQGGALFYVLRANGFVDAFQSIFEPPIWRRQNARLAVFLMFWIALLNEVAQFYVPGRFFSWADLLANVIGIVSAAYIFRRSTQFKSSFYKRISFLW
jgi:hypothetical protein